MFRASEDRSQPGGCEVYWSQCGLKLSTSHIDPEQAAEKEQAALRAETDACLANQAAVSKEQAALREIAAAEEQPEIAGISMRGKAVLQAIVLNCVDKKT